MIESANELAKKESEAAVGNRQPIDVTFRNISYTVKIEDKSKEQSSLPFFKQYTEKTILNNLSGIFKSGQVTAIMGASGAGKTTLLNAISCRIQEKNVQGVRAANGQPFSYENFGDFANYVMQQDVLMETMTVR
jgi:ABC-type multidrug transport system ATPase subunit